MDSKKNNQSKNKKIPVKKAAAPTSWEGVSGWYDSYLLGFGTYQSDIIAPALLRLVAPGPDMKILDLACGQGYFSKIFAKAGADVVGVDASPSLIEKATQHVPEAKFFVRSSHDLQRTPDNSFDVMVCVLALQNIERVAETFREAHRVLRPGGVFHIVLNHPTFRIPQASSWGFDDMKAIQYRRMDQYMTEKKVSILMHPGKGKKSETTVSFHRPLQYYFKIFKNTKFSVVGLEEWISHKVSDEGPRKKAEDIARKEFPLFLYLKLQK